MQFISAKKSKIPFSFSELGIKIPVAEGDSVKRQLSRKSS